MRNAIIAPAPLPVLETARAAWRETLANAPSFFKMLALPAALLAAGLTFKTLASGDLGPLIAAALLGLAGVVTVLIGPATAVGWHRLLLLGERPGWVPPFDNYRHYLCGSLIIGGVSLLPALVGHLLLKPLGAAVGAMAHRSLTAALVLAMVISLAPAVLIVATTLRLYIMLPARALGSNLTMRQCLDVTRGNSLRLLVVTALTLLPVHTIGTACAVSLGAGVALKLLSPMAILGLIFGVFGAQLLAGLMLLTVSSLAFRQFAALRITMTDVVPEIAGAQPDLPALARAA